MTLFFRYHFQNIIKTHFLLSIGPNLKNQYIILLSLSRRVKLDFEMEKKKQTTGINIIYCLGWLEKHIQNRLIGNFVSKLALKKQRKSLLILDSSNLVHLFSMTSYSVLIKIKVVKNDVINNFELHDQLSRIYSFHSNSL